MCLFFWKIKFTRASKIKDFACAMKCETFHLRHKVKRKRRLLKERKNNKLNSYITPACQRNKLFKKSF